MNPDNPTKCKYFVKDGTCLMKTTEAIYEGKTEKVLCPFYDTSLSTIREDEK